MLRYDEDTLRKIQMVELELLEEADRICRKNHIHYNIIAGTLLGAVRHGGFIPWDDDADIAMLRSEYDRFVEACARDLDHSRFYFQDHRTTPGYRWGYGKLRRKDTLFLREHQEHMPYEQGIFLDVFPLDAVHNNYLLRCVDQFRCFCLRKALYARVGKTADRNRFKRGIYRMLDRIPEDALKRRLDRMILHAPEHSDYVRILMFPTPNRTYAYRRKWYEASRDTMFEGRVFPGIAEYDEYLRFKYGDYRVLPPEEERKVHPVSALKLP